MPDVYEIHPEWLHSQTDAFCSLGWTRRNVESLYSFFILNRPRKLLFFYTSSSQGLKQVDDGSAWVQVLGKPLNWAHWCLFLCPLVLDMNVDRTQMTFVFLLKQLIASTNIDLVTSSWLMLLIKELHHYILNTKESL